MGQDVIVHDQQVILAFNFCQNDDTEGLLSTLVRKYLYLSSPRFFDWRYPHYHCQKCRCCDSI